MTDQLVPSAFFIEAKTNPNNGPIVLHWPLGLILILYILFGITYVHGIPPTSSLG